MKPRSFNKIDIDIEAGVVRKSSTDLNKLESEIKFYLGVPDTIKKLMPKLYRHSADFSWYDMEYLEWTTITDLINQKELSFEEWNAVFYSINEAYCLFNETVGETNFNYLYKIFVGKALERAKKLNNQEIKNIFFGGCHLNGSRRESLSRLLITKSEILSAISKDVTLLHGDFCFSNILVSDDLKKIKLLDPRGGFEEPSVYGPKIYDIAKLAQSVYSWYDKIIDGKYELTKFNDDYKLNITGANWFANAKASFSPMLKSLGLTEYTAKILAGLIIAGTPLLHLEDPNRATALALNAVLLLSD